MPPFTTRQAAEFISQREDAAIAEWQVRRLYESGDLPEPPKFGNKRLIQHDDIDRIVSAMRTRGWLSQGQERPK
ncbi:MAG: hypothetical protein RIC55_36210 [Pirellulaceae bacterium]